LAARRTLNSAGHSPLSFAFKNDDPDLQARFVNGRGQQEDAAFCLSGFILERPILHVARPILHVGNISGFHTTEKAIPGNFASRRDHEICALAHHRRNEIASLFLAHIQQGLIMHLRVTVVLAHAHGPKPLISLTVPELGLREKCF
jgi:hypothetical protein